MTFDISLNVKSIIFGSFLGHSVNDKKKLFTQELIFNYFKKQMTFIPVGSCYKCKINDLISCSLVQY